jgi:hypothetical protein
MWGALSGERSGMQFSVVAGTRLGSLSRVLVSWDSWAYFRVWIFKTPQPGGQGSSIYFTPRNRVEKSYPNAVIPQIQSQKRPKVNRLVCLGPKTRLLLLSDICGLQVGAPSLTKGRACTLLVQFVVTLGSKTPRTHDHILLSHLRLRQHGGPGTRIYILQEQGDPVTPPGTGAKVQVF